MIRMALAFTLMASPVSANAILPARMICDWVAVCESALSCVEQDGSFPTFTLEIAGDIGSWDAQAGWQGFPVMIADTRASALERHLQDNRFGLVLIPAGMTPDGVFILNGHGLSRGSVAAVSDTVMRHYCHADAEELS